MIEKVSDIKKLNTEVLWNLVTLFKLEDDYKFYINITDKDIAGYVREESIRVKKLIDGCYERMKPYGITQLDVFLISKINNYREVVNKIYDEAKRNEIIKKSKHKLKDFPELEKLLIIELSNLKTVAERHLKNGFRDDTKKDVNYASNRLCEIRRILISKGVSYQEIDKIQYEML